MESATNLAISKNLQSMVTYFMPANARESDIQRRATYIARILGSRISSLDSAADQEHIRQLLLKKVASKQKPSNPRMTLNQEALRFEDLLVRFNRNRVIKNQPQILQLLLQLAGDGAMGSQKTEFGLESVFSNKILAKVDYNASKKRQPPPRDVEMKENTKQGGPTSSK